MDIKKSKNADLEQKRRTYFLLGIILVLMLLLTALEYTGNGRSTIGSEELPDDVNDDIELLPAMDAKDMMAAPTASPAAGRKLKPVERPARLTKKLAEASDERLTEGLETGAKTTDADRPQEQAQQPAAVDDNDNPLHFRVVEELPEFPGGIVAFMKWLTQNLNYPTPAQRQHIEGKVVVSFIINRDGTIVDAKIAKSVHPLLDREAMRIVGMMPKWKPGRQNDKPCRTMFVIPINFKL